MPVESLTVSVTELMTYKRCRRKWNFSAPSRLKLARTIPGAAFDLGTNIHIALAQWLENPDAELDRLFMLAADASIERIKAESHERTRINLSDMELDHLYKNVKLGTLMMANYQQYWKTPLQSDMVLIKPEQEIKVPIPGTPHFIRGKLDGLIRRVSDDNLFVLEHKTYNSRPRLETLNHVEQFVGYAWIATQLDLGHVAGLAYDGMWKRPAPPKDKTVDDLFFRHRITPTPPEIEEYGRNAAACVTEMANDPFIYHVRDWSGSCLFSCDYEMLCAAMSRDEDYDYMVREHYSTAPDRYRDTELKEDD